MNRTDKLTVTMTTVIAATGALHAHLPPIYDLRGMGDSRLLRNSEAQVAGLTLAGAAAVSVIAKSWWPFFGTAAVLAAWLAQYELAIRADDGY